MDQIVSAGCLTFDALSDAFSVIENYGFRVDKLIMTSCEYSDLRKSDRIRKSAGLDFWLVPVTQKDLLESGIMAHLWGAQINVRADDTATWMDKVEYDEYDEYHVCGDDIVHVCGEVELNGVLNRAIVPIVVSRFESGTDSPEVEVDSADGSLRSIYGYFLTVRDIPRYANTSPKPKRLSITCGQCDTTVMLPERAPDPLIADGDYIEPLLVEIRCTSCKAQIKIPQELGRQAVQASFGFYDSE